MRGTSKNTSIKSLNLPFENTLTEHELALIKANSNVVQYYKKDIIFRQHTRTSHIMLITRGMVKVYKEGNQGKALILKVGTKKNYLGLMSVFGDDIHQYSAAALSDTSIMYIDITVFKSIIKQNGNFSLHLLNIISLDGLFIFDRLQNQSHKHLPGRIADVLLYFAENIFHSTSFELPLTRKEMAEFAGTTKESFIRTLTEFKNDKIIELNGSHVQINSLNIIKTLSALG